jgi:hypothetical protein
VTLLDITRALQAAAKAALPTGIDFVPENVAFTPTAKKPYVRAYLIPAQPANPTMGDGFYRDQGVYQLTLAYPTESGVGPVLDLAALLRTALARGVRLAAGSGFVLINQTAYIGPAAVEGDRLLVAIRFTWQADTFA